MLNVAYEYIRDLYIYGVRVPHSVHVGDKVCVPHPNGTCHIYTIKDVYLRSPDNIYICTVIPVTSARIQEVFHGD